MAGSPAAATAMAMTTRVLQACSRVYVSVRHPGGAVSRFERHPWPLPAPTAVIPHRTGFWFAINCYSLVCFLWYTREIPKTDMQIPVPVL